MFAAVCWLVIATQQPVCTEPMPAREAQARHLEILAHPSGELSNPRVVTERDPQWRQAAGPCWTPEMADMPQWRREAELRWCEERAGL